MVLGLFESAIPYKDQKYSKLKSQCVSKGELFVDPLFPPQSKSLYYSKVEKDIVWKRPGEITNDPHFFVDGASFDDLSQGSLGNCWFVAACACLTADRKLLKKVVPDIDQQEWHPDNKYAGIFHFRFWRCGEWVDVVIDDYLPTKGGHLIFVQSKERNEFWSALLEKAYAKLFGSYENLEAGRPRDALVDITGGVGELLSIDDYKTEERKMELFDILHEAIEQRALMSASIAASANEIEAKTDVGLVKGHAYSVTAVRDIKLGTGLLSVFNAERIHMVRCRNPWGGTEWTGAWSDGMSGYNQETEKKLRRAWICLKCPEDNGFIGQKFRVHSHVIKEHLENKKDSPYYCDLCAYSCRTEDELERHIDHFQPHAILKREAEKKGEIATDRSYFITNKTPLDFSPYCRIMTREESIAHQTVPYQLTQAVAYDNTANYNPYLPSFGPSLDADALITVLEEHSTQQELINHQIHSTTVTSTTTIMDNLTVQINDIHTTPPPSPLVETPLLATPTRNIILNDRQADEQDIVNILPMMLGEEETELESFHPTTEWNMVNTCSIKPATNNKQHESSSGSSSSCSSSSSDSSETLQVILQAVNNLTKIGTETNQQLNLLNTKFENLEAQVTGLRSVVREQGEDLKSIDKKLERFINTPRYPIQPRPTFYSRNNRNYSYQSPLWNQNRTRTYPRSFSPSKSPSPKKQKIRSTIKDMKEYTPKKRDSKK